MVSIQGIGGVPEPVNSRQAQGRNRANDAPPPAQAGDDVQISSAAADAARAAQAIGQAAQQPEIRDERIAQARENIEQGTYKLQEVVLQVASRIAKFVY